MNRFRWGGWLVCAALAFSACSGSGGSGANGADGSGGYVKAAKDPAVLSASGSSTNPASPDPTANVSSTDTSSPSASNPAADFTCASYVEGDPVGIAMLQAAHPNAHAQALFFAQILSMSCRRNIAVTMLVDGTFGVDRDFLGEVVRIATLHGSTLHLYLYLSNGPWQRKYQRVPNRGFGTKMPPEEFRQKIQTDANFQDEYRQLIKWVEPLISYAETRGAIVYLIPMLEDNLDAASARVMEKLVTDTVLPSLSFSLGRNPCPNCYSGNDASIAPGTFQDQHIGSAGDHVRVSGGLVTNDGKSFDFPDQNTGAPLSFDDLTRLAHESATRNDTFVVWKAEYQGLNVNGDFVDPDTRVYALPTEAQAQQLLQFLQTSF